ncbi:hypothetical protein MMC13_001702 [Lambiella insularis]|nr:hypothetical protein [Lambiella insularis]
MSKPRNFNVNPRVFLSALLHNTILTLLRIYKTVAAPIAAFTMASLLFVYTRTSIQSAKRNAQQHREADGGQISWRNESLRRHGAMEKPGDKGTVRELVGEVKEEVTGLVPKRDAEEEKIRARRGRRRAVDE